MGEVTDPKPEMTHADIVAALIERGARRDKAVTYADAFLEYRQAQANIVENGSICTNPRNGSPFTNPYVVIRDRALKRLQSIKVRADFLW
jgi:phage terminase small subunit